MFGNENDWAWKQNQKNHMGVVWSNRPVYLWPLPFHWLGRCCTAKIQRLCLWRKFRIHKQSFIFLTLRFEPAEALISIIIQLDHFLFSLSHVCVMIVAHKLNANFQKPRNHSRGTRAEINWNTAIPLAERSWRLLFLWTAGFDMATDRSCCNRPSCSNVYTFSILENRRINISICQVIVIFEWTVV